MSNPVDKVATERRDGVPSARLEKNDVSFGQ